MRIFNTILIILLVLNINVTASEISGAPNISDGDTVKILNKRIRLHGIDAPENKQTCIRNFKKYNCGEEATSALKRKISGKSVTCKVQDKLDRYRRYIGVCFLENMDINKWMVRNGYAVAYRRYSKDYVEDENYAKKTKLDCGQVILFIQKNGESLSKF